MKRLVLLALLASAGTSLAALVGACSSKGPYDQVKVGAKFPLIDSLPKAMKDDDWKTLQWVNLAGKPMTKDGGDCTGHAGVLERAADHKHWIVGGVACAGTPIAGSSGERFEGHPVPGASEKDVVKMEARFAEMLAEGVNALWISTTIVPEGKKPDDIVHDEFVIRRNGSQVQTLLEITNEGVVGTDLDGGFPKTFVVHTRLAEQRLIYKELTQRYAHESIRSSEYKSDGGTNSAEHLYGDGGILLDAAVPFNIHPHHDP